ncbi:CLUMA_CG017122, isoform A [Clunio marinus]|uniref:CLUMA_CG017122, isoform A n=1 Tax=Clunio marinus TaxID=568069 RepID=A0A1J1IWR6_9DIPT|nr:CLUMA_CG017122, isoform A [Clunio marinus]
MFIASLSPNLRSSASRMFRVSFIFFLAQAKLFFGRSAAQSDFFYFLSREKLLQLFRIFTRS